MYGSSRYGSTRYGYGVDFTELIILDYQISGSVTLNGSPVEGAVIRCIDQSNNSTLATETTDVDGNYTFTDLDESGLYHLAVEYEDAGEKFNALSLWDVSPVEVEI